MEGFLEFKDKLDEEIVMDAKAGNNKAQEYLISKYENFVKAKAKSYFLIGADKEDIYQEGMIGLYKAIRDFNPEKSTSFKAWNPPISSNNKEAKFKTDISLFPVLKITAINS